MRLLILLFLSLMSLSTYAAESAPASATPIQDETVDEPQVTISKHAEQTVEEYRANGKLYMIKISPKHGIPYYLVDDRGDGKFARQESLDTGLRVPRWVIFRF
jgi:hypothetical protein